MDVNELREERKFLEMALRQEIDSLVDAFTAKTGFYPQSISVDMIEYARIGSSVREYRLGEVNVDIKI